MNKLPVLYTDSIKYLGYTFSSNNCDDNDMHKQMRMLHCRSNRLAGLGSSTVDQVLKYTKYPKYIPSTSTGQVLIFLKST